MRVPKRMSNVVSEDPMINQSFKSKQLKTGSSSIRKQLKSNHPNWQRIPRKRKKEIIKEITDAVGADYQVFDEELGIPIEELIGIEQQQPDSRIISLQDMADFVDNFYTRAGLLKFSRSHKS